MKKYYLFHALFELTYSVPPSGAGTYIEKKMKVDKVESIEIQGELSEVATNWINNWRDTLSKPLHESRAVCTYFAMHPSEFTR